MCYNRLIYRIISGQERILHIERLLDCEPLVMNGVDHHVFLLVGYSMYSNLLAFMIYCECVAKATTATSRPVYSAGTEY